MLLHLVSIVFLPLEQFIIIYWPYIKSYQSVRIQNYMAKININKFQSFSNELFLHKVKIIYENTILGIMIGLTFFHLLPTSNQQIVQSLAHIQFINRNKDFPFGSIVVIVVFIGILVLTNHIYNCNTSNVKINKYNYRNQSQYEYELLTNQKLKIKRRIGVQSIKFQLLINLPSILSTSCLVALNDMPMLFSCLMLVAFQKYQRCKTFGSAYITSGLQKRYAKKNSLIHSLLSFNYLLVIYAFCWTNNFFKGFSNAISAGSFLYEVMIEKIAKNFEQKNQMSQKVVFLFFGILISCMI